jgi:hypothetical protein
VLLRVQLKPLFGFWNRSKLLISVYSGSNSELQSRDWYSHDSQVGQQLPGVTEAAKPPILKILTVNYIGLIGMSRK